MIKKVIVLFFVKLKYQLHLPQMHFNKSHCSNDSDESLYALAIESFFMTAIKLLPNNTKRRW